MKILALDIAGKTGWAYENTAIHCTDAPGAAKMAISNGKGPPVLAPGDSFVLPPGCNIKVSYGLNYKSGVWKVYAKPATKKRPAEPIHFRLLNLYRQLGEFSDIDLLVYEEAVGFIRGAAAVESSHRLRAVVLLWCAIKNIRAVSINPNDLLFFSLGKKTCKRDEKKREMILHAKKKYGYEGNSDDEAEAIIILHWAIEYC